MSTPTASDLYALARQIEELRGILQAQLETYARHLTRIAELEDTLAQASKRVAALELAGVVARPTASREESQPTAGRDHRAAADERPIGSPTGGLSPRGLRPIRRIRPRRETER